MGRHGARDRTLVLLACRHGLRVEELVALRWDQVDLKVGLLHVARLKSVIRRRRAQPSGRSTAQLRHSSGVRPAIDGMRPTAAPSP